jgi:hypothetical protein
MYLLMCIPQIKQIRHGNVQTAGRSCRRVIHSGIFLMSAAQKYSWYPSKYFYYEWIRILAQRRQVEKLKPLKLSIDAWEWEPMSLSMSYSCQMGSWEERRTNWFPVNFHFCSYYFYDRVPSSLSGQRMTPTHAAKLSSDKFTDIANIPKD